ncbi:MAG: hypothetical protein EPN30_07855 [Actinomycetota bacterium]|nr:MAG: hypothetical protein EPN30_07855 [Actinomycetota bacterium]
MHDPLLRQLSGHVRDHNFILKEDLPSEISGVKAENSTKIIEAIGLIGFIRQATLAFVTLVLDWRLARELLKMIHKGCVANLVQIPSAEVSVGGGHGI